MSQRGGGVLEGEAGVEVAQGGAQGGGQGSRGQMATWVEDPASGSFFRASDVRQASSETKRSCAEMLGFARSAEAESTERLTVLAARARAVLSATLMVSEGVLAGMSLLHVLVVEQCASNSFLVVSYLQAARATQQTFHFLCTFAVLSSLVALSSASQRLQVLSMQQQRWELLEQHRDASYTQAAAFVITLLYTVALVCSLITSETEWRWSLVDPHSTLDLSREDQAVLFEVFDGSYTLWRTLSLTRTASCILAWLLATAFYSRQEISPDSSAATGRAPDTQPSLISALVSATSAQ
ncbi:hypothetical protein T492DRAFT_1023667 [Pavlovales sp. CCMP2436]|nr:hypothetical protein T492DRAFT_1023667 [Pavlovales sp. CCMP2436]